MVEGGTLPEPVRERLIIVKGLLEDLVRQGRDKVTSRDLARWLGTSAATVRKDLSWFSPDSTGAAYDTSKLIQLLNQTFEPAQPRKACIVGLGELGLAHWNEIENSSKNWFQILVAFDSRPNKLEQLELPFPLHPTTEIVGVCLRRNIEAAILTVPDQESQRCADRLVQGGIKYIVNYTQTILRVNRAQIVVRECGLFSQPPRLLVPTASE